LKREVVAVSRFLCRLGLHRWKHYGERKLIIWKEPGLFQITMAEKRKRVFSKRECSWCGIKEERKLIDNLDGTFSAVGWGIIEEKDE
jgi:hypothetical protein